MSDLRDEYKKAQEKNAFNLLNDLVWVKLTIYGKETYNKHIESLKLKPEECKIIMSYFGYVNFQLWYLMNIFGPILFGDNTSEPFVGRKIHNKEPQS
ncbi:MAG: hypothetical protein ACI88L_000615 [Candidatus Paceibacteria bacterium]|jgi:hypothetical protein